MPESRRSLSRSAVGPTPGSASAHAEGVARRVGALLEFAPDGVIVADSDGTILLANARAHELFGYADGELHGLAVDALLPEAARAAHAAHRTAYLEDPKPRMMGAGLELWGQRKDRSTFPVDISLNPLRTDYGLAVIASVRDITARRQVEEARRESEERFRGAFTFAAIGMAVVAPDGRFLEVNDSLCEIVGYSADELLARTFQDITHPDDLESDLEFLRQMLAGEIGTYQMEKRYFHKRGSVVWVLLSVSLVRGADGTPLHFISQIQDITEQKQTQEKLRKAEHRFRTLIEQLPLCTYIRPMNLAEPNVYVSPQVEPMLGYPAKAWETDPKLLETILHPEDRDRVLEAAADVRRTGRPAHQEYRLIARDGQVVWVQDETYVVEDEHGKAFVQGYLLDVTRRKQAMEESDRLREELYHAQKLDALGQLAGGVAHDFNNMLTAIEGYSELLIDGLEPGSALRKEAEQILRAAQQASALPRQLLAFSRKQVLEPTRVNLNDVVRETTDLLERVIGEAVELETRLDASQASAVLDRGQVEQVLVNLAVNARDAMAAGGRLTISTRNALVEPEQAAEHETEPGPYVVIAVTDTGHGMDAETRERIFEPFFTTKKPGEGSGLGLATVYGIVRQSGGFVAVDSKPGEGSTFEVYLPGSELAAADQAARPAEDIGFSRATVLLAEDETIVRELAVTALERAGYRVLAASNGREALELFERSGRSIDALVTDMVMPGMGGNEFAAQILDDQPGVPVVLMSGYTDAAPAALEEGTAGRFLQKPFSPRALVNAVREAIERAERNGRATVASSLRDVTCVVADDHPAVLDSVSHFFERAGIRVVGIAASGEEALEQIAATRPSVALVDVQMEPIGGVEVVRRAAAASPGTAVVLYTGYHDRARLDLALDAGARGFVLKGAPLPSLVRAIETVAGGGTYVDAELSQSLVSSTTVGLAPLTRREQEVLTLLAEGMTNEKVGNELGISPETVQSHVHHAMVKLDADTRTQAVATAIRQARIS